MDLYIFPDLGMATPTVDPEESSLLRKVTPEDLFNLPLYEHHLMIDTQPLEEYTRGNIATAVSYPSLGLNCSEEEREKSLILFVKKYIKEYSDQKI